MTTSSRIETPTINLKERIAALQQRSLSPDVRSTSPTAGLIPSPTSAGLRAKIAKFEKRGSVPKPRGSFGLGAPPPAENGLQKRRGELYGNRIPPGVRASFAGASLSRPTSPLDSARSFSMPPLDTQDIEMPESSPYLPSSFPSPPSSPTSPDSLKAVAGALQLSTAVLHHEEDGEHHVIDATISSPVFQTSQREVEDGQVEGVSVTPSIVISSDDRPHLAVVPPIHGGAAADNLGPGTPQATSPSARPVYSVTPSLKASVETKETPSYAEVPKLSAVPPKPSASTEDNVVQPSLNTTLKSPSKKRNITAANSALTDAPPLPPVDRNESLDISETTSQDSIPSAPPEEVAILEPLSLSAENHDNPGIIPVVESLLINDAQAEVSSSAVAQQTVVYAPQHKANDRIEEQVVISGTKAEEDLLHPESPIGPHTLANVVASLGQMVADIHDLFPDQLSPLMSPPTYKAMNLELALGDNSSSRPKERKKPLEDLTIHPDKILDDAAVRIQPDITVGTTLGSGAPAGGGDTNMLKVTAHTTESPLLTASPTSGSLSSPHSPHNRPISMMETSPGQLALGRRMTRSMGRAMYVPPQGERDLSHFPPTPGPQEAEAQFGTVLLGHAPAHSNVASFSAVVHGKITEPSSSSSPGMLDPQAAPKGRSSFVVKEGLVSPGHGELASLLQSAALLEETLEKGELPGESPRERSDKQEKEAQERAEAVAKARAEEEEKIKQAITKNRVKDQPKKRTKRSFGVLKVRNPSISSSEDQGVGQKDLATHLPFRPQPTRRSTERPSRPSEASSRRTLQAPSVEIHADPSTRDADAGSQTSPKSPLHYLANLRRFASASCVSGMSNTHPRHSASTSSEMSSDDSVPLATPPDNGLDGPTSSKSNHQGSSIQWPSLSPKKSGGSVGRATAFAEKMWHRGRSKSNMSTKSAYDTIDRLTRSAASKAAVASLPPLDPISFSLDVTSPENINTIHPSPQTDLISPRRSKSFQAISTSQFPPLYTPTPTSPVYTSHLAPSTIRSALRPQDAMQPLHIDSLFPTGKEPDRPTSLVSEGVSEGSSNSSILSPLFDSFPSVPASTSPPLSDSPCLPYDHRPFRLQSTTRQTLPPIPSFFDAAPLSSAAVGAEFFSSSSPFPRSPAVARSATLPPVPPEWQL